MTVRPKPGAKHKGILTCGRLALPCVLGRSGTGMPKLEGDGKTPRAAMKVAFAMCDKGRWPLAWRRPWMIGGKERLGWCDAPHDANYNRAVRLPFDASHETLKREDRLYDCVVVLDWNMRLRTRNRGSAIFMHVARDGLAPTEGCIALKARDLARLVVAIGPGTKVKVL
jgi:L,D-peptidoglycan transpeptidase YkuD (ErfK/YbiS/YcfS/YnhG family)